MCAVSAAVIPDDAIEVFMGAAPGHLTWGPALFRILLAFHGLALVVLGIVRRRSSVGAAPTTKDPLAGAGPALVALVICAVALRTWRLGSDLWLDEVLTLIQLVRLPLGKILISFSSQNQHMLYSILAHASIAAFGESAWALRLPSMVFGCLSIWPMYLLTRHVLDSREALLATALMVFSSQHIWFSQNARGYTGLLFFTLVATWAWLKARSDGHRQWWAWYVAALVLGMWINMTMIFVAASHAGIHLASSRRWWPEPYVAWLFAASLTLQLFALALPEFISTALHESSFASEWTSLWWMLGEMLRNFNLGIGTGASLGAVFVGLAIAAAGFIDIFRRDAEIAAALVLPGLLSGACMLVLSHNLWPRFFFFCMGFGLIVVVHGLHVVPRVFLKDRQPAASVCSAVLVVVLMLGSAAGLPRYYSLPKQDYRGAQAYVEHNRQAGSAIVTVGLAATVYQSYLAPEWPVATDAAELERIRTSHAAVWLVYTLPAQLKAANPPLWNAIENDFEIVKTFPGSLGGGQVLVCRERRRPPYPIARSIFDAKGR